MRVFIKEFGGVIIAILFVVFLTWGVFKMSNVYNEKPHQDDVQMTEWISPDGVHYWYQQAGYHAMLAPRYDANGQLVIE